MDLNRYLEIKELKQIEFAAKLGRSRSTISLLCSGKRKPSAKLALQIEEETAGLVSRDELIFPDKH